MKSMFSLLVVQALVCGGLWAAEAAHETKFDKKPSPDKICTELKDGNSRFIKGECSHPNSSAERRQLAFAKSQGDYAVATVLGCSDSRVPLELIFDAGIMDLFVIRVPGNICKSDEIGGVEYGIHHAYTPVVVVLGHSDCGAVTAAVKSGHKLERNIPELLKPIKKLVEKVRKEYPGLAEKELIEFCIRENVYYEIEMLFEQSAATRNVVKAGKVKVTGAVYDLGSGKVEWLDQERIGKILATVEANGSHAVKEFED